MVTLTLLWTNQITPQRLNKIVHLAHATLLYQYNTINYLFVLRII